MARHWFTPDSARRALVRLRPAAERMCRLYETLARCAPRPVVPEQLVDPRYFLLVRRLHRVVEEIRRDGVEIRDLRRGLLDFPARRAGRAVHLCWGVGESTLRFWRDTDSGPDGPRPLDEDGPWDDA